MRIRELEPSTNSIRQNIVDDWLDGVKGTDTTFIIYVLYGKEGIRKAIESGEIQVEDKGK